MRRQIEMEKSSFPLIKESHGAFPMVTRFTE
jgi:hypothetical protein